MSIPAPTWDEVKARSEHDGMCCADCWIAFEYGGLPCSVHATPAEKALAHARINDLATQKHPLFDMVKKR